MNQIQKRTKTEGLKIFERAIENASPNVEVKSRRIGGATYQVPIEVPKSPVIARPNQVIYCTGKGLSKP